MTDSKRSLISAFLKNEIVGPRNIGNELDTSRPVVFESRDASAGPWISKESLQEILQIRPKDRYGSGILEPVRTSDLQYSNSEELDLKELPEAVETLNESEPSTGDTSQLEAREPRGPDNSNDHIDAGVNSNRAWLNPRSVGISFMLEIAQNGFLRVRVTGGTYRAFPVKIKDKKVSAKKAKNNRVETPETLDLPETEKIYNSNWYERSPFEAEFHFLASEIENCTSRMVLMGKPISISGRELKLDVSLQVRPQGNNAYLCTLSCVNRSAHGIDENTLYQTELNLDALNGFKFAAYPEIQHDYEMDLDDESALLLFSNYPTFAIGHNLGVEWDRDVKGPINKLSLTSMPEYEAPSITPDFAYPDGSKAIIDMRILADERQKSGALEELQKLVDSYNHWINIQKEIAQNSVNISSRYSRAAKANIQECEKAALRMQKGIDLLRSDSQSYEAFRLANVAMLRQQYRSKLPLREVKYSGRIEVVGEGPSSDVPSTGGTWRPFQIAFFLSVLESITNPNSSDRDLVDLIFFPTGGGKTEAYLGVTAYVILMRRLRRREDEGTAVLMRYTLRLLTTQQFLRAAALICALEDMRRKDEEKFGNAQFSIGAWLGGAVTPNSQQKALAALKELRKRGDGAGNPFLLLKCPWCGTQLGPVRNADPRNSDFFLAGYKEVTTSPREFRFHCPDLNCEFSDRLPLTVIDEEIYNSPPTLLIGTVDKFAQMAWQEGSRSIFGINSDGVVANTPPELIIQDEFHLISGPLGSMVGLYEGVVEKLCTQRIGEVNVLPKIISSTATIRRYRAQAEAIYGRSKVSLFPPPCIDAADSFFAVWARNEKGELLNGRKYVGINAPGLGSVQSAQVRVGAALAQAPMEIETDSERDPWWTNLWFFNSIRELSNTVSLFQSDIPNYLLDMKRRYSFEARHLNTINELTSRRQSHEIPKVLQELEKRYEGLSNPKQKGVWDACLASNIIEVGIDIERLSLMTIVSQPKSTAQYIQVSGRVGRNPQVKPGLVVTIYTSNRPRDLSHFEHFRSYHEKLYAQVEPTSVTPFSSPVLKRALRGAAVAYLRMLIPLGTAPKNVDSNLLVEILYFLKERAIKIGLVGEDLKYMEREVSRIIHEWNVYRGDEWGAQEGSVNGLLTAPTEDKSQTGYRWVIPVSMRNVDASVELEISRKYRNAQLLDVEP